MRPFTHSQSREDDSVRFGDMTFEEIRTSAHAGAIVVLPTGCTEQQGPHLAVDFDTWFPEALLAEAADHVAPEIEVIVLPALPFGPAPEHRNFGAGFIDIPIRVYDAFVTAILDSLAAQGFKKIVIWRGCGGHDLSDVVVQHNRTAPTKTYLPEMPFHDVWCSVADPSVPGGHADSFTTSIALYRRPAMVRRDRIPAGTSAQPDWADPALDFTDCSTNGVVGTAAMASVELGHQLWISSVASAVATLRSVYSNT